MHDILMLRVVPCHNEACGQEWSSRAGSGASRRRSDPLGRNLRRWPRRAIYRRDPTCYREMGKIFGGTVGDLGSAVHDMFQPTLRPTHPTNGGNLKLPYIVESQVRSAKMMSTTRPIP